MTHTSLDYQQLYNACKLPDQAFATTADLEALQTPLGQQRAIDALQFGIDIKRPGFNIFALGPAGIGKHQLVSQILGNREQSDCSQYDWCYVNNFSDPGKPKLLKLDAALGTDFTADMLQFVEDLLTSLPSSFQNEEYQNRRHEIEAEMNERYEKTFSTLGAAAKERNIALLRTPAGYTLAPMNDGAILQPEEFAKLSEEEQKHIQQVISELQVDLQKVVSQLPMMKREASHRLKELNQEVTQLTVEQFVGWLENRYQQHLQILSYLAEVKEYAINNAEDFLPEPNSDETGPDHVKQRAHQYAPFKVNVFVNNTDSSSLPVVYEENPTYQNLIGRVEYVSQMGTLLTDFTLIKNGALHRANGGYLILDAHKVLTHIYAWEGLKQALQSEEIKITSLQERLSLNSTVSLEPECVPLDVKVILLGEPTLYYLLNHYDPEFKQLFHVAADFSYTATRDEESHMLYARMIAARQQHQGLLPLNKDGVEQVIEHTARLAEDSEKLSLNQDHLNQLLQEADYWARRQQQTVIRREDVQKAIATQRDRHGQFQELLNEHILRDIRMIDTEGRQVAQVNGLSVMQQGEQRYGSPSRITATARLGSGKLIDIERESKLGGDIHSKGVLILSAYLADRYARENPLPLAASLVFEQSYGGVDGDSATCAELCALLSAIGDIPLSQNLAVTGSMNQRGEVQAIGGINHKIEGFFDICNARGLTGDQGVIIPAANQTHLMLRQDVRDAVAKGRFHIYTTTHVEDVMELLSGLQGGELEDGSYPAGTFNRRICDRIEQLQKLHQLFAENGQDRDEKNS